MSSKRINITEDIVRGLLNNGVKPKELLTGIYNAFAFGQILTDNDLHFTDDDFDVFIANLGDAIEISRRFK